MSYFIPSHGNPEAKKYGVVGESSNSDNGSIYGKKSNDKLNVGWDNLLPTFTPTPTPTQTMTVTPTRTTTMPVTPTRAAVTPSPTPSLSEVIYASQTPTPSITQTVTPTISVTPAATGNVNPQLSVNGGQAGIAGTIGSGFYPPGTVVYVEAILAPGFVFDSWSDTGTGHLQTGSYPNWPNPNSILMPAFDIVITPIGTTNFTLTTSTTVISLGPLGQSPGGTGPTGGGAHSNGEVVNVSITPDANTSGVLVIDGNPRPAVAGTNSDSVNITMTGNRTAQAQWSWKNVNWRTSVSGGGSANPVGPGNVGSGIVKKTQTINIIANVSSGTFGSWSCTEGGVVFGNASLPNTSATINSDGEHTLVANLSSTVVFVSGVYSQYGVLSFDFSWPGGSSTYTAYGSAGSYVYNILCASSIGTIHDGNAWLSGTAC